MGQVRVQALVVQATIKRLHKAVLLGAFDKLRRALPGAM
jgi:hypothetical protein